MFANLFSKSCQRHLTEDRVLQLSQITVLETSTQLFVLIEFDVCVLLCGSLDALIGSLKHMRRKPFSIAFECCDHLFAESEFNALDPFVQLP